MPGRLLRRIATKVGLVAPAPEPGAAVLPGQDRVAIAAIFRNEGPYILEWLAHHRLLGVTQFFIADHQPEGQAGDDGSTALLAALDRAGLATHLPFSPAADSPAQMLAYDTLMQRFRDRADWVLFSDADEFLRPTGGFSTLQPWLATVPPAVGALGLNWANYGADGRIEPGAGLVQERFTRRGSDADPRNCTFKSLVRTCDWAGVLGHPHRFVLREGQRFVSSGFGRLTVDKTAPGRAEISCWTAFRLDHFLLKSHDEFHYIKRARGLPVPGNPLRPMGFFTRNDRNEVSDPVPLAHLDALRAEIARIRALLAADPQLPADIRDMDLALPERTRLARVRQTG